MAKKKSSVKNDFIRIMAVLAGVLGAGWLFSSVWRGVLDFIADYSFKTNFFDYFFGTGLLTVATLLISVLFFVASLRDLEVMKRPFALVSAIVSGVAFAAYIFFIARSIDSFGALIKPVAILNISNLILLFVYILFSLYQRNGGSIKKFAWILALVAIIISFVGALFGYITKDFGATDTISLILTGLAHLAVFYCGLRQY